MSFHILKKTKQKPSNKRVFGFDIETYNNNLDFYCGGIYLDEFSMWTFYDKRGVIEFLKDKIFKGAFIVASNLAFDFFGTFNEQPEVLEFDTLFRGSDLIFSKTYQVDGEFCRRVPKGKKSRGTLTFIDTFNYCKMSVKKLGNIINLPKLKQPKFIGEKPVGREQWREMTEYNMRDSEVSKKYIDFLFDAFTQLGATPKLTIASTAMSLFKNKYLGDDIYFRHRVEVLQEIFKGYYGGRVEVFNRGVVKGYNYYDFNSLYPSCMLNQFPNPNTLRTTNKNNLNYINEYEGMSEVTIVCPSDMKYPLLPFRTEDKLIFPTGKFRGWYCHVEIRKALSMGYKVLEVHRTHYYLEVCEPFREYVEVLYKLRLRFQCECPECGNHFPDMKKCPDCGVELGSPMEQVVKLLLNGLYGKFGQKFENRDNWMPFNHTVEELDKMDFFERFGDFIRVKKDFSEPSSFCIPIWAAHVTAYARIKLHDAIIDTNPVYCDTDSIVTKKELITSKELGMLKLEMPVKYGIFVKAKMYAILDDRDENHVKIKGISKKLSVDDFNEFLKDPSITYKKFVKLKESMRRGLTPNEIIDITKTLTLEDTKRVWPSEFDPNGLQDSAPIHVNIDTEQGQQQYRNINIPVLSN